MPPHRAATASGFADFVGAFLAATGVGVDAYRVDHPVGASASGEFADHRDGVLAAKVDRFGVLGPGPLQPSGYVVHRDHPARAHTPNRGDR